MTPKNPIAVFELLETRTLLSATLINGTLDVEGTRRADVIDFSFKLNDPGHIVVSINGTPFGFRSSKVGQIVVNCGLGNDTVNRNPNAMPNDVAKPTTIICGGGNDRISGNKGNNSIEGQDGNDSILTFGGNDFISGGAGIDSLTGGGGRDTLHGDHGSDFLSVGGGVGGLVLGGRGDDYITGNSNSNLFGNAGVDSFFTPVANLVEDAVSGDTIYVT